MKNQILNNQRGQTLIEYLIIVALVGVGSIALMRVVSHGINNKFADVVGALGGSVDRGAPVRVTKSMLRNRDLKDFASGARLDDKSSKNSENSDSE
jgi:Flp pilus assembly pilin Flp